MLGPQYGTMRTISGREFLPPCCRLLVRSIMLGTIPFVDSEQGVAGVLDRDPPGDSAMPKRPWPPGSATILAGSLWAG